jgi:FkbM family methyltransferase
MKQALQRTIGWLLRVTGLEYLPVKARRGGFCAGARWTLYPWSAYWRGGYEPDVARAIGSRGDLTGKVCWDLGAHFGYYAIGLAMRTGPSGQVLAVEPFPPSYARLELHKRMNGLSWLKTLQGAASDVSGTADFVSDVGAGDTTVHLPYDGEVKTATTPAISVRIVRLDDLVAGGEIRPPDFMKIDVEGHGHRALAGAIKTIRQAKPTILMGFHSPQEVAGTEALLLPLGYRFSAVGTADPADRIGADYLIRVPAAG